MANTSWSATTLAEVTMATPDLSARIWTLSNVLSDAGQQQAVESALRDAGGSWSRAAVTLRGELPADSMTRLTTAQELADWSDDHAPLVRSLVDDPSVTGLRSVAARFDLAALAARISPAELPADAPGATPEEKATRFATELRVRLFAVAPTPVLQRMVVDGELPAVDPAIRPAVATFLSNQPDLELRTTSVRTAITIPGAFAGIADSDRSAVVHALATLQCVQAISPVPEAVTAVTDQGLRSAFQVAQLGERAFVRRCAPALGDDTARQVHANAMNVQIRNQGALARMRDTVRGSGLAVVDGPTSRDDRVQAFRAAAESTGSPVDLEQLFGSLDECECDDCLSVYSPAAYFVELLQFLRNGDLDPTKVGDPNDVTGTPLEMLLRRRPDIGRLELTCENTFTVLPYVDLANEVMESFTVHLADFSADAHVPKQATLEVFDVHDETSGELLAQPQHVDEHAYCVLKNAVYPFTLPYDQPVDVARLWLPSLDTNRAELLDVFRPLHETCDGVALTQAEEKKLDALLVQARDRAVDAERLGLSQEQYIILTREAFRPRAYFELTGQTTVTAADYREKIGVRSIPEYFGYPAGDPTSSPMLDTDETTRQGLTFVKASTPDHSTGQFLARTGIHYTDLVDLLRTRFVNPSLPTGTALTILDSIRFSYRFLQSLVDPSDPAGRFAKLIAFLRNPPPFVPGPTDLRLSVSDDEIAEWVRCQFERVGRLVVLDSGERPTLSLHGGVWTPLNGQSTRVGTLEADGAVVGPDGSPIGRVTADVHALGSDGKTPLPAVFAVPTLDIRDDDGRRIGQILGDGTVQALLGGELSAPVTWTAAQDRCDLERVRITHLDGTRVEGEEYDRMQRFVRLWQATGWTMAETDQALTALTATPGRPPTDGACDFVGFEQFQDDDGSGDCGDTSTCPDPPAPVEITPAVIHGVVTIRRIVERTGLPVDVALSLWVDISTTGDDSLYARLFLTHDVLGIDPVFASDANGNYLTTPTTLTAHLPAVCAALQLSPADASAIIAGRSLPDVLSLATVSALYRHRVLARVLGVKVPDLSRVIALFGDPFAGPEATCRLLRDWQDVEDAGFTHRQLDYVVLDHDDPRQPLALSQRRILQVTKALYDGLTAITQEHPDVALDALDQATDDAVRADATELLAQSDADVALGLLDGTTVHTTNAPPGLGLTVPPELSSRLTYTSRTDPTNGTTTATIGVTGILDAHDAAAARALSADPGWAAALDRADRQPRRFFQETLSALFPASADAATELLAGDRAPGTSAAPDPGSAPGKRAFFLHYVRPVLRARSARKVVVETVAATVGLDTDVTDVLLAEVLCREGACALDALLALDQAPADTGPGWRGYLVPPSDADYTFVVSGSTDRPDPLVLNGVSLPFPHQNDDPSDVWSTEPVTLRAGTLVRLDTGATPLTLLSWRTTTSTTTAVPSSALLPDHSTAAATTVLTNMTKAAVVLTGFPLSTDEMHYVLAHRGDFDDPDLGTFTLASWRRLRAYTSLRSAVPSGSNQLLGLFTWASTTSEPVDATVLSRRVADATGWDASVVADLITPKHFDLQRASAFRNEIALVGLRKAVDVVSRTAATPTQLFGWADPSPNFWALLRTATAIQAALRARYEQTTWEKVVKPLYDALRGHQQAALRDHLVVQPALRSWGVVDADSLFEFFLLDVQMSACLETSRIKQAISTVQSYVQRCLLGLEADRGVAAADLDRGRWEWMQKYVLWAADRKVYVDPENWLQAELRDDKSPFFLELEAELLQKDVDPSGVADALRNYVGKVDEVANLQVVGLYADPPSAPATLHLFGRTRGHPNHYFHRTYLVQGSSWSPWERVPVDIPDYTVETPGSRTNDGSTATKLGTNGSYVIPAMSRGRLLVFFPLFLPKNVAKSDNAKVDDLRISNVNDQRAVTYWEVRLGWSEYRNEKWTSKEVSTGAVTALPDTGVTTPPDVSSFTFVPHIDVPAGPAGDNAYPAADVVVDVFRNGTGLGAFAFMGGHLDAWGKPIAADPVGLTVFDYVAADQPSPRLHSLQRVGVQAPPDLSAAVPYAVDSSTTVTFAATAGATATMTNAIAHDLVGTLAVTPDPARPLDALKPFFAYLLGRTDDDVDTYGAVTAGTATSYNELAAPNALYTWEAAFHTPMLLVDRLLAAGRFDDALTMCHYVFDPFATGEDEDPVWRFRPFHETDPADDLEALFAGLAPNTPDPHITEWRNHPFQPHVVARGRPLAYMKWVAMTYLRIWIAYGDFYFRQNTLETLPLALQCYIVAAHVYGPRGERIPKRGATKPETFTSLVGKWDAFGNAMVEMELAFPFSNQIDQPVGASNGVVGPANIFGFATSLYFCVPDNPDLAALRDTIDDRLFKIRNCQDINGAVRQLPLFEPPVDPGLLVAAAAQGLDLATVLADLDAPMPNYRFSYLLAKAFEMCAELKSLGSAMLAAKEKHDAEALAVLRANHETAIQRLVMEVRTRQAEEASRSLDGLTANRQGAVYRLQHQLGLLGQDLSAVPPDEATEFTELAEAIEPLVDVDGLKLTSSEKEEMDKAKAAQDGQDWVGRTETLASVFHAIPIGSAHATPIGVGAVVTWGGSNLGNATQAVARYLQIGASDLSFQSSNAGRKAGFTRQLQERVQQANIAGHEITSIDKQILAQQIRTAIAAQEITNQQRQIDQSVEVGDYLTSKYTNADLYTYLDTRTRSLYYQAYTAAYELAKKAEKLFRFERGPDAPTFLQFGYWDPAHDGLLAGEQLHGALRKLEAAHLETCPYDVEVSKPVSLRQLDPEALLTLRETGTCEFQLPEVLFDMDFPGHYQRRIRAVSVTIPAVVGPYTSLNATLRLLGHRYRHDPVATTARDYLEQSAGDNPQFTTTAVPTSTFAVSTGLEGGTEMTAHDERFMPCEGAGVISSWRLGLPEFRQFDYDSITDVILTLRYTALDGGDRLRAVAASAVQQYVTTVEDLSRDEGLFAAFDLRNEFADEWYRALHAAPATMTLAGLADRLPYFTRGRGGKPIPATDIYLYLKGDHPPAGASLTIAGDELPLGPGAPIDGVTVLQATDQSVNIGDWQLTFASTAGTPPTLDAAWLVLRYVLPRLPGGSG